MGRKSAGDHLINLVGTPNSIAGQMQEIIDEVGSDGFILPANSEAHEYL